MEFTEGSRPSPPREWAYSFGGFQSSPSNLSSHLIRRIPASPKAELPAMKEDWFVGRYKMKSLGSEMFVNSRLEFQKACAQAKRSRDNFKTICELYKSLLDRNFAGRFCIGDHCTKIFMVEIKFDGNNWGATPKIFYSEAEAKVEAELLRLKYPFLSECRVVTRKEKEKD